MIIDNLIMNWFWYPANKGLFIGTLIPSQWGLFIGILIPKPMRVIHWYSNTQPMMVIHWYFDAQSRGYSVTIVIRLLRIWIMFEYLNYFESLNPWFSNSNHSLNCKRERFKVFEVEPRSNHDDIIINLIIN